MTHPIGFVILSHRDPRQLTSLIERLNALFATPPIACHHDIAQSSLDRKRLPSNVSLVEPARPTRWGHISLVHAGLAAIELLFDRADAPTYFMLLSAADYPLMSPRDIVADLATKAADAFLTFQPVVPPALGIDERPDSKFFIGATGAYDRYLAIEYRYPSLTRRFRPTHRKITLRHPLFLNVVGTFPRRLRCFAGDHWFTGNQNIAAILLRQDMTRRALFAHYDFRVLPEESFYQTVLCNESGLRIYPDNLRFTDWSENNDHPKILKQDDLERAISSKCHFGRKLDMDTSRSFMLAIDEHISSGRL